MISKNRVKIMLTQKPNRTMLDAIENSSTKLIPKGSILFVVRSGILRRTLPVALTICEVTVNQDLQAFTPKEVLPEYIYWYVSAMNDDIRKTCSKDGTTVESIESSLLKNYSIPICSPKEQQLIVSELESKLTVCDNIEETISHSLQQAETLRQSILKKAFEGKLVAQNPNDKPAPKLLERIKAESPKNEVEKKKSRRDDMIIGKNQNTISNPEGVI